MSVRGAIRVRRWRAEGKMLLRQIAESDNNDGGKYFGNRGVKVQVLHHDIQKCII